ncbi:DUF1643 domain-containing protein [Enterococcus faecium]|uniref:DUF1643 domain-containing protein n=1 Tax=Enterococcus faecium TaxID=1352 RepID=UPI003CE5925D
MVNKVTENVIQYPKNEEPNFIVPNEYKPHRFGLGRKGENPIVAICMNPSAASEMISDRTINRVIKIGQALGNDGWIVFNTYPERATDAANMDTYDENLSNQNLEVIKNFIIENSITEVYGAWGDLKYQALKKGKDELISLFRELKVNMYYFGTLTKQGNPRHPIQRQEKWKISTENKRYLM